MRFYVAGGGPSLDHFDWTMAERGPVIACHEHAHRLECAPEFQLSPDWVYWRDHKPRPGSIGVWVDLGDGPPGFTGQGLMRVPAAPGGNWAQRWGDQLRDGVMVGGCSGVAALHFACLLGAREVHLVGIDQPGARQADALDFAVRAARRAGVEVVSRGEWRS